MANVGSMKFRRSLLMSVILVLLLVAAGGGWLHVQQQQYVLNRQLIAALKSDDTTQALELVKKGADPNTRLQPPPVPSFKLLLALRLHRSVLPANISPTAFLLACGTDYEDKHTHCKDETELVQVMLAHGADLHAKTANQYTALEGTVSYNHPIVTEWLLENGANPNEQYADGGMPLRLAASADYPEMICLLLRYGARVNAANQDGRTALMEASAYGSDLTVAQLMRAGANVNQTDKDGTTALLWASGTGSLRVMRLLLAQGASLHVEVNGWTPLRYAVEYENPAMVELLLAHHADLHCRDDEGSKGEKLLTITYTHTQTPVKQQIRRLLRQADAKRMFEK